MQKKTLLTLLSIVAIIIAAYVFHQQNNATEEPRTSNQNNRSKKGGKSRSPADYDNRQSEFNRRTSKIIYTKHARCRMACRHIDETEVKDILERGRINQEKSDPASRPDPKYALDGRTHDGQEVRIVFAAADEGMVVITVIDLQKEWSCNCK
ncbi:MAG TPA: DUF4258 domain-containing protein [Flavitalea sp.]|nr:DUF4258 domain-containing protein [Flavitalea sp.]